MCFRKDHLGFSVNEIICKPNVFTQSRKRPEPSQSGAGSSSPKQIEATAEQAKKATWIEEPSRNFGED
jgi:hypothetical protein